MKPASRCNIPLALGYWRTRCSLVPEWQCIGRRPKIKIMKTRLPFQPVGLFSLALMSSTAWPASQVSFSQPVETVEAYDYAEVIALVDKPDVRTPFLVATVSGSFSKADRNN